MPGTNRPKYLAQTYRNSQEHRNEFIPFAIFTNLSFFISIIINTYITVKYDREKNEDKYYSILDIGDYLKRFFLFAYWPITIWSFQEFANDYNKEE